MKPAWSYSHSKKRFSDYINGRQGFSYARGLRLVHPCPVIAACLTTGCVFEKRPYEDARCRRLVSGLHEQGFSSGVKVWVRIIESLVLRTHPASSVEELTFTVTAVSCLLLASPCG